jgi:hypothetical protein
MRKYLSTAVRLASGTDPDDIVWGVDGENGIAAAINRSVSQTYYLIRMKKLPVKKHGHKTYSASRSRLHAYLAGESSEPAE